MTRAGDDVLGVLTVRAGRSDAEINASSLTGTLGDQSVTVALEPISRTPRRAMLVVDTSGSMGEEGMRTARSAAKSFIAAAPKDVLVGLVSFANTSGVDVPLTVDRARLGRSVDALQSNGETALYAAIQTAAKALGPSGERSVILLSDGGDTMAKNKARDAEAAVATLTKGGIRAEVVAFNTDETDTKVLDRFAAAGGGSVVQAGDDKAVTAAFTAAAKTLDNQVRWRLTPPASLAGRQQLVLSGSVGPQPFRAVTDVDLGNLRTSSPTDPPAGGTPPTNGAPAQFEAPAMSWMLPAAIGALFLGLFGLVAALLAPAFQSKRSKRVAGVEVYLPEREITARARRDRSPSALTTSLVAFGDKRMADRKSTGKTMALIERADLPFRAGEWWVIRMVAIVVVASMGFLLMGGWIGLILGILLGILLPAIVLRILAARRAKQFDNQLPDALMLVSSSLGAGFSLHQALDAVAKDSADPLAKEFSRALAEARIGAEVADALERVGERMDSQNTRWTAMAIKIQREVGGNLAETLRTTAQTIRDRHSLTRHVAALSAEGKLSAYILIALPIGLFVYMLMVNRPYVALLWTTPLGLLMTLAAVALLAVGTFWMSKTVKVEV
ncbi:hypothetical protein N802_18445 [Knoellia sinensis KCTC 19936]|uniref:VWFA domain-containing protein n=1 Tax=Knoellia sinensis KCTC 19936 TaxID=1385520 RepID=A0A0A0J4S6_9MICO|nr:type II secretion system F family protein [Knoellia sinensis]KGN32345.1 hypothetical protein N802_18445 [Knoellia sinensis KCTC 19936]